MTTIRDIAKNAGVSVGTVSRYLNGTMKVKPETADRIDQAVRDLDYVRNYSAATIKTKTSNVVALVFPSMQSLMFGEIAEAISNTLSRSGYILNTFTTGDNLRREQWAAEKIRELRVAGAVFVTEPIGNKDISHLHALEQSGIRTVMINRFYGESEFECINVDYAGGIGQVMDHLFQRGCRLPGMVCGWPRQNQSVVQAEAFRRSLLRHGLSPEPEQVKYMYYKEKLIQRKVHELLDMGADAIIAVSDRSSVEVNAVLEQAGKRIPEDVALVSLGNTRFAKILRMTALDLKLGELGEKAARMLLARMEGKPGGGIETIVPELVVRRTS